MDQLRKPDKLHLQAEQHLLELIQSGVFQPGQRLPSEVRLAAELGISRPTLREALLHLARRGAIVRRHGVGTFVADAYGLRLESGLERLQSVLEMTARQGVEVRVKDLECSREEANSDIAERLALVPGALLTAVRRTIVVEGRPVAYMHDLVLPSILAPHDIDESFGGSVLDILKQEPGLHIAQADAEIVPVNADRFLADRLKVRQGQAILLLEEVLVEEGGTPIDFSRNYFVPDYFRFHVIRR